MTSRERRKPQQPDPAELRTQLNPRQNETLKSLEHLGWQLAFVRRPLFQAGAAVVADVERKRHVVLGEDGMLKEQQELPLRK